MLDNGLTDIVTERYDNECYDAGVRMGEHLAKDMISARIGPDFRLAVVGVKSYFADHPEPAHPKDLVGHTCIKFRLPTSGGLYAWEFEENGRELKIRGEGQLVFNNIFNALDATLDGFGLACIPEEIILPYGAGAACSSHLRHRIQKLVERDRVGAHAHAGGVVDRVGDGGPVPQGLSSPTPLAFIGEETGSVPSRKATSWCGMIVTCIGSTARACRMITLRPATPIRRAGTAIPRVHGTGSWFDLPPAIRH